jgi:hypothetical protein
MKNNQQATHNHKRAGSVVLLESTTELAKVLTLGSEDELWVRLTDLTPLVLGVIEKSRPSNKRLGKDYPNASPDSHYHAVRAA